MANFRRMAQIVLWGLCLPALFFGLYTWLMLHWSYSTGERAGYVQKLSKKGVFCKTYEGELILVSMPGTQAEKFYFTVKDPNMAQRINASIGMRVRLSYAQHIGLPGSCFGDTEYFVDQIQVVDQKIVY